MNTLSPEVVTTLTELMAEKRHIVKFTNNGWTIAHPIKERLDLDTLFSCRIAHKKIWMDEDPGIRGMYWLNDDGSLGGKYEG